MNTTIRERLHRKLRKDENGCLIWTGAANRAGYGNIYTHSVGRKSFTDLTHRVAWKLAYGDIPPKLQVLHECDTPRCCNPEHLMLGTQADNMEDKSAKGRAKAGPVSKREWWTPERRAAHAEELARANAERRSKMALIAGFPADWKYCPGCKEWLPRSKFHANRARFDGLSAYCKYCRYELRK